MGESIDIFNGDMDGLEQEAESARRKYQKKKSEIEEGLKEAQSLKEAMEETEKNIDEAKEELAKFQKSKDVVKGINVMMRSAGEVMTLLIQERPEFKRLYAKKKERLSLFELMKRKKESESEIEPMAMADEPRGVKMNRPMPKKAPEPLRKPSMDEPEPKRQKVGESPKGGTRLKGCFFCGEESHKAMYCEAMAKLALELGGSVPSMEDRRKANAGLFCKFCQ